eukprot:SAG31_NODE_1129_length_9755_cov_2.095070_7_plen_140_part_00
MLWYDLLRTANVTAPPPSSSVMASSTELVFWRYDPKLRTLQAITGDLEALEAHHRDLAANEQNELHRLLRSNDLVVLHQKVAEHTVSTEAGTAHPLLARELTALCRHVRKCESVQNIGAERPHAPSMLRDLISACGCRR